MNDKIPFPPQIDDLDEIKRMIGADAGDVPSGGAQEGRGAFSLDDIMAEFSGTPGKPSGRDGARAGAAATAVRTRDAQEPARQAVKEDLQSPAASIQPESTDTVQDMPAPEEKPAAQKSAPRAAASADAGEGTADIRDVIAMQVESALNQKQTGEVPRTLPRAVAARSAVQLAGEFEDGGKTRAVRPAPKKTGEQPSSKHESALAGVDVPAAYRPSDDLRMFRGMTPADAGKKAKNAVGYYVWRTAVVLLLALASFYITVAPTYLWPLPSFVSYVRLPYIYLLILGILQIVAMLISISLVADGLRYAARLQFKAESLIVVSNFVTLFHTFSIILFPRWGGYLPYTAVAIFGLFIGLLTRMLRYRTMRSALRTLSLSERQVVVHGVRGADGRMATLYKTEPRAVSAEVMEMLLEEDGSERLMRFYVPLAVVLSVVFAVIASFGTGHGERFIWCLSAVLAISVPAGVMLSGVLPGSVTIARLSGSGVLTAGLRGLGAMAQADAAVVTERDLFPAKLVAVGPLRVFGGFTPDKVIMSTLGVLQASGSSLYDSFAASLPRIPGKAPVAENFEFYETGGIGAYINGDRVLIGTSNFAMRMGVRITEGAGIKNNVFVVINSQHAGSFTVKYDVQPSVRRALNYMVRRRIVPVIAVRDFNITPPMLESKFKLSEECFGFPGLEERIAYSGLKGGAKDEICAVMVMDNLINYAELISSSRRIRTAQRLCTIFGAVCAGIGIPLVFYLLFKGAASSVTPFNVFYYLILWFLPVLIASIGANRR